MQAPWPPSSSTRPSVPSAVRSAPAGPIPVVTLGRQEGQALRDRVGRGSVLVEVAVDADAVTRQSRNVIGRLPGPRPGAIVIGGHFDSVAAGPGANDNASGTATMLELARVFSERQYPYTLYFVAFGSEDNWAPRQPPLRRRAPRSRAGQIRAMVNLDMVGVGDEQRLTGTTEIVDVAREVATAMGLSRFTATGGGAGASSDHESFQRAGIPILFIHRSSDPNYHSPRGSRGVRRSGRSRPGRAARRRRTGPVCSRRALSDGSPKATGRPPAAVKRANARERTSWRAGTCRWCSSARAPARKRGSAPWPAGVRNLPDGRVEGGVRGRRTPAVQRSWSAGATRDRPPRRWRSMLQCGGKRRKTSRGRYSYPLTVPRLVFR